VAPSSRPEPPPVTPHERATERFVSSADYRWPPCRRSPPVAAMPTLEEVTYEAGRGALADQESLVAGIRQRTGTLLAAHALVASFLGATTLRDRGLSALGWVALVALVLGLVAAAILLGPWRLGFAMDARKLFDQLREQACANARMACSSGGTLTSCRPSPLPSDRIRKLSTDIFIEEFRGQSRRGESRRREAAWRAWTQSPSRVRRSSAGSRSRVAWGRARRPQPRGRQQRRRLSHAAFRVSNDTLHGNPIPSAAY